jgi:hypothetical protein
MSVSGYRTQVTLLIIKKEKIDPAASSAAGFFIAKTHAGGRGTLVSGTSL